MWADVLHRAANLQIMFWVVVVSFRTPTIPTLRLTVTILSLKHCCSGGNDPLQSSLMCSSTDVAERFGPRSRLPALVVAQSCQV